MQLLPLLLPPLLVPPASLSPPPSAAAAAAAAAEKNNKDEKKKKSKTPSWLANARRVNVWSVKVRELARQLFSFSFFASDVQPPPPPPPPRPRPYETKKQKKTDPAPSVGRPPLPLALLRGPLLLPRPSFTPAAPALAPHAAQRLRLRARRRRPPARGGLLGGESRGRGRGWSWDRGRGWGRENSGGGGEADGDGERDDDGSGGREHLLGDLGVSDGGSGGASAAARAEEMPLRSLFPPLSASVASSLDPVFRLSIFVVSLLLTLRLGRAYERWWEARRSFAALGSLALSLAQRGEAWFGGGDACDGDNDGDGLDQVQGQLQQQQQQQQRTQQQQQQQTDPRVKKTPPPPSPRQLLAEDLARWGVVWQFSVLQIVTDSPRLHPAARRLLRPAELALYDATPKGRQLALQRLTHLLTEGPALAAGAGAGKAAEEGINPVVVDNMLRAGATAAGACTGIKLQVRERESRERERVAFEKVPTTTTTL